MKPTNLTIKELFTKNPDLTFLVGAGCSVDAPSCQPAGRAMMDAIIKYICVDSEIDKISKLEELRFEALVEILRDFIDPELKIIDYYGLCDKPNIQHFFLAEMIKQGHFVMTTNFDFLIEIALLQLDIPKEEIKVVITKKSFEKYSNPNDLFQQGIKTVYKIHGSTKNIIKDKYTKDTLIATIQAFGANKEGLNVFQIEPHKRELFDNITRDRTLVVMGYSGSDDFDIVPTLKVLNTIKNVIWINFIPDDKGKEKIYEVIAIPGQRSKQISKVNQILMDIQQMSYIKQIYRVDVNTSRLVKELLGYDPPLSSDNFIMNPMEWLKEKIKIEDEFIKYFLAYRIYTDFDHYEDGSRCMLDVLEKAEKADKKHWISVALNNLGLIKRRKGKYNDALQYYEKSLHISKELGDDIGSATNLNNIATIYIKQGKHNEAHKKLEEAIKIDDFNNNYKDKIFHLNNLGSLLMVQGENEKAWQYFKEALKISEQLGDLQGKSSSLSCLGSILEKRGDFKSALKYREESFQIYEKLGSVIDQAEELRHIGNIYAEQGDLLNALKKYEEGSNLSKNIGDYITDIRFLTSIGEIYRQLGDHGKAAKKYQEALSINEKIGDPEFKKTLLNNIGLNHYDQGDFDKALEYYEESIKIAKNLNQKSSIANCLNNISMAYVGLEKYDDAVNYMLESLKIYEELNDLHQSANCLMNIGGTYFQQKNYHDAKINLEKALKTF